MPQITIYVSAKDLLIVKQAKADIKESLSAIFIAAVRKRLKNSSPVKAGQAKTR